MWTFEKERLPLSLLAKALLDSHSFYIALEFSYCRGLVNDHVGSFTCIMCGCLGTEEPTDTPHSPIVSPSEVFGGAAPGRDGIDRFALV